MTTLTAIVHVWRVATEAKDGLRAAENVLRVNGSPLAAFEAFCQATATELDDEAARVVRTALGQLVSWVQWGIAQTPGVVSGIDQAGTALMNLAYRAGKLRTRLEAWLVPVP